MRFDENPFTCQRIKEDHTHTNTHTHTHTHSHTHTHTHARTHARTHACTHARTHAHTHTHKIRLRFPISHFFYRSFSSDTTAVKGLTKQNLTKQRTLASVTQLQNLGQSSVIRLQHLCGETNRQDQQKCVHNNYVGNLPKEERKKKKKNPTPPNQHLFELVNNHFTVSKRSEESKRIITFE